MREIRLSVIGCGAVATIYHLPAIKKVPQVRLAAVVDVDTAWVQQVARRYSAPVALSDYRQVVGLADAALIATPNVTHAEIAGYLLEHGVHVLCEKPLAVRAVDAQHLFDLSNRGATRLMVAQTRRFNPNVMALAQLVQRGVLGELTEITAGLGGAIEKWAARTLFRTQRSLAGGGVLTDSGVHLIDMAIWLFGGEPSEVMCHMQDEKGWGVETDAEVQLKYASGGCASLVCSYTHGVDETVRVQGEDGWASTSIHPAPNLEFYGRRSLVCRRDGVQQVIVPEDDPCRQTIAHFCESLLADRPFMVRQEEVMAGLHVLEQCYATAGEVSEA